MTACGRAVQRREEAAEVDSKVLVPQDEAAGAVDALAVDEANSMTVCGRTPQFEAAVAVNAHAVRQI